MAIKNRPQLWQTDSIVANRPRRPRERGPFSAPSATGTDSALIASLRAQDTVRESLRLRPRYSFFSVARLSAVPRMSPSVAPESDDPYWAIASFSSATSSALIDTVTL